MALLSKYANVYLKIKRAQGYDPESAYDKAQSAAMAMLTRDFKNPEQVWQAGLESHFKNNEARNPDFDRNDPSSKAGAADYVKRAVEAYRKGKIAPFFEIGQPKSKAEKSQHTKNSYPSNWPIDRSGMDFTPEDVVSAYNIQTPEDAMAWGMNKHRSIDSIIILFERLAAGEAMKYDGSWKKEEHIAKYIEWLIKAKKWQPETDHFTQVLKVIRKPLNQLKKQFTSS